MKFSIRVHRLTKDEEILAEQARTERNRLSRGNPRLSHAGHLIELAQQGWEPEQIDQLLDAWPEASKFSVSMLVSLAAAMIRKLDISDVHEIIDWTKAVYEQGRGGMVVTRPVVRQELRQQGEMRRRRGVKRTPTVIQLVRWYEEAAGSRPAALRALQSGLTVEEAQG